jgi:type III secretion system FlhB-like substrate exporter
VTKKELDDCAGIDGMKSKSCSPLHSETGNSPKSISYSKSKIAKEIAQVASIAKQIDPYGFNEIQNNIIQVVSQTNVSILQEPELIKTLFGTNMSPLSHSIVEFCREKLPVEQSSTHLMRIHKALMSSNLVEQTDV